MSIFDRKRSAPEPDVDIEIEQPRYQQPVQPQPQPRAQQPAQPQPAPEPKPAAAPAQAPRGGGAQHGGSGGAAYGIQKAIELMRSLPSDNIPLIVQVVRTTLESTNIDVPSIIEDAKAKRARITSRVDGLRREIANFEEEIAARREEIVALDADHAETKLVQERLEMAIKQEAPASRPVAGPGRPVAAPGEPAKPSVKPPTA
jgi:hypothetical protein